MERCVQIAFPYSSSNTAISLLEDVDRCLAKMYILMSPSDRALLGQQIELCVSNMVELEKSKPEYKKLQRQITEITSNLGDSIVDAQHTVGQLTVCNEPLKHITNLKIFEESRFDSIAKLFVENLESADKCVEDSMVEVTHQTSDVDDRISSYKIHYQKWLNLTSFRQDTAELCKRNMTILTETISHHIISELGF